MIGQDSWRLNQSPLSREAYEATRTEDKPFEDEEIVQVVVQQGGEVAGDIPKKVTSSPVVGQTDRS